MGKIVAFIVGLAFIGLQLLAYEGIIIINYDALQPWGSELIGQVGGISSLPTCRLPQVSSSV
jgi:uncharacterized membrane protein (Fun14 family)